MSDENGAFKNRVVGLEMIPAKDLKEHPRNWRQHPEDQRAALLGLLESVGIADSVLAYTSKRDEAVVLIDGHLRKDLVGDQEVPVVMTDLDDDEADALLAAHDVVTTMALPDAEELQGLLDDIIEKDLLPNDVLLAIDPDFGDFEDFGGPGHGGADTGPGGKFPIVPQLDEGYDFVVLFATRDTDFAWLQTVLDLPKKNDKGRIGTSRVLTVEEFKERWASRG